METVSHAGRHVVRRICSWRFTAAMLRARQRVRRADDHRGDGRAYRAVDQPVEADCGAIASGILRIPADPSRYDDDPIRWGVIATVFWAMAGIAAGLFIALPARLPAPQCRTLPQFRPAAAAAHLGVIFAFGGNALIATSFYVVQRTCRARLAFPGLARFVFWGYQLFIVLAASGYLLGHHPVEGICRARMVRRLWLTVVWVAYWRCSSARS